VWGCGFTEPAPLPHGKMNPFVMAMTSMARNGGRNPGAIGEREIRE
jgi:hypothetical protein